MNPFTLSDKIFKALTGHAGNGPDTKTLDEIAGESSRLESLVDEIQQPEYVATELKKFNSFDIESGWESVSRLAGIRSGKQTLARVIRLKGIQYLKWTAAAAVVAIAVLAAMNRLGTQSTAVEQMPEISEEIAEAIAQGEEHGLTGAIIEKKDIAAKTWVSPTDSHAIFEDTPRPQVVSDMLSATKITTYHDKEYWLELSDGTIVHLGRNSRLVYPDRFVGDTRDVYLEGEAYFMVTKNPKSMFIVHTAAAMTKVYGTEFNVSTRGDNECRVVLVNGSVRVEVSDNDGTTLVPGEMAIVDDGTISVSETDIEPYRAWNTGRVDFVNWPLANVLAVIGKWYGRDIVFDEDSFGTIEITGSFNRYDDLEPTLNALSTITGLGISSTGNIIHVSL